MKSIISLICLLILGISVVSANPQNQFSSCGNLNGLSVVYPKVDNMGYAPRPMPGSENVFNCIAAQDANFNDRRLPTVWQAFNYWAGLYGQVLGQPLLQLPAPLQ